MWSKVGAVALVAVGAGLWRQRPAVAGSRNAATRAVVDSAKLFKDAAPNKWRNGRLTGIRA